MNRRELLIGGAAGLAVAGSVARAEAAGPIVQRIMVIRHAEKPIGSAMPYGITAQGVRDFHALTVDGWNRAGALVELFAPAVGPIRAGLSRPGAIFASPASQLNESLRPTQTVTPLAQRLGTSVTTSCLYGQEAKLAATLLATPGVTLTAWQHQHIPLIAQELGLAHLGVPKVWPGPRFDMVFVFTRRAQGGWTFAQIPQLVLAGDIAAHFPPIAAPGTDD